MSDLTYSVEWFGESRSFPSGDMFVDGAGGSGSVLVLVGAPGEVASYDARYLAVLVELGTECLAVHTGELDGNEVSNVVGFSRWRLGENEPSNLIEIVASNATHGDAVRAARALFEAAGFDVSQSADRPGRIVDRLIRPQFNLALEAIDDGLATTDDFETCLIQGLGYRKGLLTPLLASGLEHHHDITADLFKAYAKLEFNPARRAVVAKTRASGSGA